MVLGREAWATLDVDGVLAFLRYKTLQFEGASRSYVELPWDLIAPDYLRFAKSDLRQRGIRGRVNGLGNAKRALHCQVDSILHCTGLDRLAERGRWNSPAKMNVLAEMDIVTPRILRRINTLRNQVEHDYSAPRDTEQLQDFLDAVELFISATEPFGTRRYDDVGFSRKYRGTWRQVEFTRQQGSGVWIAATHDPEREVARLSPTDPSYKDFVIALHRATRSWNQYP